MGRSAELKGERRSNQTSPRNENAGSEESESAAQDCEPRGTTSTVGGPGCGVSICKRRVHLKRIFLPVAGGAWLTTLAPMRTYIYFPIIIFSVAFVLFWNFPCIVTFANSRPLYYEDVFAVESPDSPKHEEIKKRFEGAYEWSLIVVNSLFAAALAEYWLYQTGSSATYTEILGVTGGIMKVFQTVNYLSGSSIIAITRWHVRSVAETQEQAPNDVNDVIVEIVPKIAPDEDNVQLVVGERASPPIGPVTMTSIEI